MTNNDELAIKLKAAAEKALPAIQKYESGEIDGDDALEMLSDFTDAIKPANILALLAERDADKKRIKDLEQSHCGGALMEREEHHVDVVNKLMERIAELEARTVRLNAADIINVAEGKNHAPGRMIPLDTLGDYCAAAGIKLEVGE